MNYNGLILVNKPQGITSHDVVAKVRRILKTKAVGHCGTLDPMATGLLVIMIGEATKLSQYILNGDKSYRVKAKLGVSTDTLDATGQVLRECPVQVSKEELKAISETLSGVLHLKVPAFSAIKIDGTKLYERARSGEEIEELPEREMHIKRLEIRSISIPEIEADILCSKGTYIRSWVQELGERAGCGAVMTELSRTASLPYNLQDAISLEELEDHWSKNTFLEHPGFVPMEAILPDAKVLRVKDVDEVMLGNGLISFSLKSRLIFAFNPEKDECLKVLSLTTGKLLALIVLEPNKGFSIRRVFKY